MLVMLALATHVTVARADGNTITQTAITSPSDPAYFYDATAGAYGGITVAGTTNSTDPSSDEVDIDCYDDNGSQADSYEAYDYNDGEYDLTEYDISTLVTNVPLNADGSFSATIPYSAVENSERDGECRLRAVPAGTQPSSALSSYAGPRVLLAYLAPEYSNGDDSDGNDSVEYSYELNAPQLGAVDTYYAASDPYGCGLNMNLASTAYFSETSFDDFDCSDSFGSGELDLGGITIDGQPTCDTWYTGAVSVQVSQDSTNGDITVHEDEPLALQTGGSCYSGSYTPSGVEDDRTIQQAADGKVVMITDDFVSTDGASHEVDFDTTHEFDMGIYNGSTDLFELPGQTSYSAYSDGDTPTFSSGTPGTIYAYNNENSDGSDAGYDALTYFTEPSGPITFHGDYFTCCGEPPAPTSWVDIPFTLDVPAGGSQSLKIAYASEYSQPALAGDLQTELDLQTAPTVTISSPSAGSTVSTPSATVTGSVSAATGVESVSVNGQSATVNGSTFTATVPLNSGANTITAVVTTNSGITASDTESITYTPPSASTTTTSTPVTPASAGKWAGPVWLPIADTGSASRAGRHKEKLSGRVTAGSGTVTYYFQYGPRGHLNHRTAVLTLAASNSSTRVALTVGGLRRGTRYTYKLVATGTYGHSAGRSRSFKTAKHAK